MKTTTHLLFFLLLSLSASAQETDSIRNLLESKHPDTTRYNILIELGNHYQYTYPDSAWLFHTDAYKMALKLKDRIRQCDAMLEQGWDKMIIGELDSSYLIHEKAKEIIHSYLKKTTVKSSPEYKKAVSRLSTIWSRQGIIYKEKADYRKALDCYFKSMKIDRENKIGESPGVNYANIGVVYKNMGEYDKAISYYEKAARIFKKSGKEEHLASTYGNIGNIYVLKKQYEIALVYYKKGFALDEKLKNKSSMAADYGNFGMLYEGMKDPEKALEYYRLSEELYTEMGNHYGAAIQKSRRGQLLNKKKKYAEAEILLKESFETLQQAGATRYISDVHLNIAELYQATGRPELALKHFRDYMTIKDSLTSQEYRKSGLQKELEFQYDLKVKEDSIHTAQKDKLTEAELAKQDAEIESQNNQKLMLFGGLGLLIVFSIFIFNRFRVSQKQKKIIEDQKHIVDEKNKEILDSITYAKRIQEAILPSRKMLQETLKNGFVLYKPKDIVAGDFYWMERPPTTADRNYIYFAAADCTGHGVPGAMVSVVCSNALSKALLEEKIMETGKILDRTRELVVEKFSKSEENVRDGMDISLVRWDIEKGKLQWSGANNPLWLIRNGELKEFKPDKQPIGKYDHSKPFVTHEIELQTGDLIYIFTDGFQDQFGGADGKKFKASRLKESLKALLNENMDKQRELLEQEFENWRGKMEQIDDVCMIGIRI